MSRLPTRQRSDSPLSPWDVADRLLEDAFVRSPFGTESAEPALDVYETDNEVVVKAMLPGMDPDDVEVTMTGDTLTIRGEVKEEEEEERRNYIYRERRYGKFSRRVRLPKVDSENIDAEFENGLLTIKLGKPEEKQSKSIKVKAKD